MARAPARRAGPGPPSPGPARRRLPAGGPTPDHPAPTQTRGRGAHAPGPRRRPFAGAAIRATGLLPVVDPPGMRVPARQPRRDRIRLEVVDALVDRRCPLREAEDEVR